MNAGIARLRESLGIHIGKGLMNVQACSLFFQWATLVGMSGYRT